jgi:hypothetical protein
LAAAAKPAVQSEVWKNRDEKWIEADGEAVRKSASVASLV